MSQDQNVRDYLRQAEEAEARAEAETEPFLKQSWLKIAQEYRLLAQSRVSVLTAKGMMEQPSPVQSAKARPAE
jgi:hypothetical protein